MPARTLKAPYRALWEITWRCDLRCEHCLVRAGDARPDELSTHETLGLVDQLADLGVSAVSLTGGEPLVRRDWPAIAERVRSRGMRLRLASNGHLLTTEALRALVELGAESFSVSLDGTRPTHDRMRRLAAGARHGSSYDRVLAALDRLRETPIVAGAITTVTRQNIDELPAIHAVLKEHGVSKWIVQLAHRTGRLADAETNGVCDPIDPAQLVELAAFIVKNAKDPVLAPRAFNSIGYLSRDEPILRSSGRRRGHPIWHGCRCGVTVVGIEPDGGVKGCANQVGAPFVVGNVRTESLRAIWEDRARWHWLNPAPEKMAGECAGCALAAVCQAGCTTLAYRASGNLFDNPYCLRREERRRAARNP